MFKFTDNRKDIINLCHEAFGDCEEDINYFIDNVRNTNCLAYYVGDEIASMMFLVKCSVYGEESYYVYAACTAIKYRNQGLMTKLLDFAKENYSSICLVPALDPLIEFYMSRGFTKKIKIEDIKFKQKPEIVESLFEGYQLTEPTALMFGGK